MTLEGAVTIVRREDGFEKRHLWRCDRCKTAIGYELEDDQYSKGSVKPDNPKVLYILPGWLLTTEEMSKGRKMGEGEVTLESARTLAASFPTHSS
jgi:hypothetical protein